MKSELPGTDVWPDPDKHPDKSKLPERRITQPRAAAFQWPPDCLWPFMDRGPDRDA
jgi:hypothetical protein